MSETKSDIRKRVITSRNLLNEEERYRSEVLITERIIGHQWYYKAQKILLFSSYNGEIDTKPLILDALHKKKIVYLPKIVDNEMIFIKIHGIDELCKGYKGILEPVYDNQSILYQYNTKDKATLMIMPGVAFDSYRNRIGYGKGFYDRFLHDKEMLSTIAIGFKCQMVDRIEADDYDYKPMQVICL